ncbi:hypothetical protein ABMV07_10085 [Corynebacterium belfantii]|uniref:hypothetical protein n=1 Tax=Corynebacterium belfantii TaxID=2014537 RepID=UPI0018D4B9B7|nr:hypothetical protein [Corynebacterium belfantii]MBG9350042.1 hypothetical protein [Corynebacterium belfantii]
MLLVAAGSMAVIYGEGHPFRTRWRIIFIAGVLFIAATGVGAAVGHVALGHVDARGSHWWYWWIGLFTALMATASTFIQNAQRLPHRVVSLL